MGSVLGWILGLGVVLRFGVVLRLGGVLRLGVVLHLGVVLRCVLRLGRGDLIRGGSLRFLMVGSGSPTSSGVCDSHHAVSYK